MNNEKMLNEFSDLLDEVSRVERKYGIHISQIYTPSNEVVWRRGEHLFKMNRNREVKVLE